MLQRVVGFEQCRPWPGFGLDGKPANAIIIRGRFDVTEHEDRHGVSFAEQSEDRLRETWDMSDVAPRCDNEDSNGELAALPHVFDN